MNPVQPMVEAFLDIYSSLPTSLIALIDLAIGLFITAIVISLLNRVR